ncbi:MAG: PilZ domain-containing protein [Paenibacillaceae bacterium]
MLPTINQLLFIQVASMDEEESQHEYKSRISDVGDAYIAIEVPISVKTGRLKQLVIGDQISAHYKTEGGVKNFFSSEVIGLREEVIKLVLIKPPELDSITRVQRRNYLRVPAELEIAIKLQDRLQILGVTDDVSGGGLSFICDGHYPFKSKEIISCWLLLNYKAGTVEHMPFHAEVVRIKPLETGKQLLMCSFTDIAEHERQKVIRYCFERQFDLRKK